MALDFKGKLGPLPVWAWGTIAAVGGLIVYYLYSRSKATATKGTQAAIAPGAGSGSANFDAMGYQTLGLAANQSDSSPQITDTDTNQKWISRAAASVANTLALSVSNVTATLQRYVAGYSPAPREQKVIDEAISSYGQPPQPVTGNGAATGTAGFIVVRNSAPGSSALYKEYADGTVSLISGAEWTDLQAQGYSITGAVNVDQTNNLSLMGY